MGHSQLQCQDYLPRFVDHPNTNSNYHFRGHSLVHAGNMVPNSRLVYNLLLKPNRDEIICCIVSLVPILQLSLVIVGSLIVSFFVISSIDNLILNSKNRFLIFRMYIGPFEIHL